MVKKNISDMAYWPSLTIEGNIISTAMISEIDRQKATEQDPSAYDVRKGINLREEISMAFRVGQAHYDAFGSTDTPNASATTRFVSSFLEEVFGFDDIASAELPLALVAGNGRIPIAVVPRDDDLDKRSDYLSEERSRSAAFALQDHLNDRDEALWGLATNGAKLRLMRDNASLTRPAYIEANIQQIFENEDIASFAALWLLIHRSRFGNEGNPATDCALERWRDAGAKEGETARNRLAGQVEEALKALGSGFLTANPELQRKITNGEVPLTDWFNELLRLVYRIIFMMVAEDRNLLHDPKAKLDARRLYSEGYSLAHLRQQSIRRSAWDRYFDRYEGMKIVFRALENGEARLGLSALGGLFAATQLPELETAKISNKAFLNAIYRLGWLADGNSMVPVNWRAMETEELGSVYESLLELQPQLSDDGKELRFAQETSEKAGNQRKTTGSYYTPDSLVQALLNTALDPVLDKAESEAEDPAESLLNLSVIDPACGSGHFLLAAARRIASRVARIRGGGTAGQTEFRHALRDVARRCIHGVDRNPMAVELTKVALWIETVDPGLPLGFFDAQIRCGDALLGVFDLKALEEGIPDAAYKPLSGDDKNVAKFYLNANKDAKKGQGSFDFTGGRSRLPTAPLSAEFSDFRDLPEETVAEIEAKKKAFRSLRKQEAFVRARMGCNLYTAAFLLPKTGEVPRGDSERTVPTSEDVWLATGQGKGRKRVMEGRTAATRARVLHWPLEFPDVIAGGGFDVVLGNPPWERIKLQEKEFFASRDPEIATASNKAARDQLIKALREAEGGTAERILFQAFEEAKRISEATSAFVRVDHKDGGRFPLTGTGDVNTYALFAELFSRLPSRKGQAGVILPTGIATDATTAPFFAYMVEQKRLKRLVDFENSAPIFPSVHRSFKFCLLTLGRDEPRAHFSFFLTETSQMAEPERNFTLSPDQISAINPNTRTAPVFRSRVDAELTAKIYQRVPVLVDERPGSQGSPWILDFHTRIWHMAEDSEWFRTTNQLKVQGLVQDGADWVSGKAHSKGDPQDVGIQEEGRSRNQSEPLRYVPLFEAKMIHQFDHRWSGYCGDGGSENPSEAQKKDFQFSPSPRYWVPQKEVDRRLAAKGWNHSWLMPWRDITNATNERTSIFCIVQKTAVGHTSPLMFPFSFIEKVPGLYGNLNSLVLDFVARQKVGGTHLTFGYLKQFPLLLPGFYSAKRLDFITPRVVELTYTSDKLAAFAKDLGYDGPPFAWNESRRVRLRAELDAFYARAYGLTLDELRYILDPKEVMGEDYPSETFRVLKAKEIKTHGEYRTQRLVLEAWDRMEADGTFADMDM